MIEEHCRLRTWRQSQERDKSAVALLKNEGLLTPWVRALDDSLPNSVKCSPHLKVAVVPCDVRLFITLKITETTKKDIQKFS